MKRQIGYEGLILKVLGISEGDLLPLRQKDTEQIDIILNNLTLKEQEIIKMRFGLNQGMALTLREVAEKKGVTLERIRQIEHKALRKLKHLSRVDAFERCSRSGLEKQIERLKERNQILEEQISTERQPEYFIPIEKLELSVRTYNCLQNLNIKTLGDLTTKGEKELLRVKNFGRKGLNEIKEILSHYNLKLKT